VKRLPSTAASLEFHLEPWEGVMLAAVLSQYPCLPPAHQPLSRNGQGPDTLADQRLLDEALADQRRDNQRQLTRLLADTTRFRQSDKGWRLSLAPGDAEWVLQILNDIRVGSWAKLGSPDDLDELRGDQPNPDVGLMETAGYFQMRLLAGLRTPPDHPKR